MLAKLYGHPSRVKGKAFTSGLRKECTRAHAVGPNNEPPPIHVHVDYTDEWIRHVILNGLYDDEIRRDVFSQNNLDSMNSNNLVTMIDRKETARDATMSASASAISQYRKNVRISRTENREDVKKKSRFQPKRELPHLLYSD